MFKRITLEMSLKPFKQKDDKYIKDVIAKILGQWTSLLCNATELSILLWCADGSEILDYSGDMDENMEWCRYIGGANRMRDNTKWDPEGIGLHSRAYYFMDDPISFTYGDLKRIVRLIKETAGEMFPGKGVSVGETFDPGPEFARSDFKYNRHNEICDGSTMGERTMVCCYSTLHGDNRKYAAFPDGIKEGTPLATFLGRQSEVFLREMGFDYLWLSNGFGFGLEPWSTTGAIFDGKSFNTAKLSEAKEKIMNFWRMFRRECHFPVETRGTNLSAGIDYATDGVPLDEIYKADFDILPPPNSPWAALNSNFGLELCGYMSRIAELPSNEDFLFRYYIHDPWWANTPWEHRYDSLPHDIYLPMSLSRLNKDLEVGLPTQLNLLTVDNSFGDTPDYCAFEPSMHINRALRYSPDEPAPVIWVYPFDEYLGGRSEEEIGNIFFGDWFITGAINHGFPIGSVMSSKSFLTASGILLKRYPDRVIVTPVPDAHTQIDKALVSYIKAGGKAILYGGINKASEELLTLIGAEPDRKNMYGEMSFELFSESDTLKHGEAAKKIIHRPLTSGRGIGAKMKDNTASKPFVKMDGEIAGSYSDRVVWLSGTVSADYIRGRLLTPDNEEKYFSGESLMRLALGIFGVRIRFEKESARTLEPVITISRHDGAFMFAASSRDTTVKTEIKMPLGAPIPFGREVKINADGFGEYHFSGAEFFECRIFVSQEAGVVSCHDMSPGSFFRSRKMKLSGLKNATVRFFAPHYCKDNIDVLLNSDEVTTLVGEHFDHSYVTDENGTYFEARGVTGTLFFGIPFEKPIGSTRRVTDS